MPSAADIAGACTRGIAGACIIGAWKARAEEASDSMI
jgi:hypothetical protein